MKADIMHITALPDGKSSLVILPFLMTVLLILLPGHILQAQDELEDESAIEIFWGDEDEETELEGIEFGEDEFDFADEFDEDDAEFEFGLDFEIEDTEADDEFDFGEEFGDDEETIDISEAAARLGYTLNIVGSSPSFVNHQLSTYNSGINFRASFEFPMLLEIGPLRFRLGAEVGNFKFTNYKPAGGTYSGIQVTGILSFPAGPGQVKLGGGMMGSSFGVIAENTYGISIGNSLDIRIGIRSSTGFNVINDKKQKLGTVSWLDGLLVLGISL